MCLGDCPARARVCVCVCVCVPSNCRALINPNSFTPLFQEFPWKPKTLLPLTEESLGSIKETAALVCFNEEKDADTVEAMLRPLADQDLEKTKPAIKLLYFYVAGQRDDAGAAVDQLRGYLNLGKGANYLVLLDIPNQRRFVAPNAQFTTENVSKFVSDFRKGKLGAGQGVRG